MGNRSNLGSQSRERSLFSASLRPRRPVRPLLHRVRGKRRRGVQRWTRRTTGFDVSSASSFRRPFYIPGHRMGCRLFPLVPRLSLSFDEPRVSSSLPLSLQRASRVDRLASERSDTLHRGHTRGQDRSLRPLQSWSSLPFGRSGRTRPTHRCRVILVL